MIRADRETCNILIVENSDDIRAGLANELNALGHAVTVAAERGEALALEEQTQFDLLVSDLVNNEPALGCETVRSFKMSVTGSQARRAVTRLHDIMKRPWLSSCTA
jgi:CheY-like chemotaxis protein